jgi:predicted dithiol-disulfide oxidoreductase (DUF899 family)
MATSDTKTLQEQIDDLEEEIVKKKGEVARLRRSMPRQEVSDFVFHSSAEDVGFSSLFEKHDELIIIHNMGKGCRYCTLWADGFNGVLNHLENRAAFAVVSPDDPQTQKSFAESRGWKFRMLSGKGNDFTNEMGFISEKGGYMPGISTFIKDDSGKIYRVAKSYFGPGDDFCGIWHIFDLLVKGANDWEPQYKY